MAALNPMPNYNNHCLLRMKDAEKVNRVKINVIIFTINLKFLFIDIRF